MKFQKFPSFIYYSFISFVIMATGCAKPNLKMPESLPPIIKSYKHVKIYGNNPRLTNTGVYLTKGDIYSLLGTGTVHTGGRGRWSIAKPGRRTIGRIGENSAVLLSGSLTWSGDTMKTYYSGNLFLGIDDGGYNTTNGDAFNPKKFRNNVGYLSVDIMVWEREDWDQIAVFYEKMRKINPTSKIIDLALKRSKERREFYLAELKASKEIEETKKELKELKKDDAPKKKEPDKTIAKEDSATSTTAIEVKLTL